MSQLLLVLAAFVLVLAGTVNGLAGFGFALIGTMVLASITDPATAIVVMIIPILAVNSSLVRELSVADLRSCGARFTPLLSAALVGTVLGMAIIDLLPDQQLRALLGAITLGFVINAQNVRSVPFLERAKQACFVKSTPAMIGVGGVGGVIFGGTNVGIQLVAYVRSFDLSHRIFVGVIALVFLGLNGVRVATAAVFGMYTDVLVVIGSLLAIAPALLGVALGRRLRERVTQSAIRTMVLLLLTVVGLRLLMAGVGVV